MQTVGFIGLGNMGSPMAINLAKAGFAVQVFDLVQSQIDAVAQHGAKACTSANEAVTNADVVISMLPAGHHVRQLYCGEQGVGGDLKDGCLVIDCSTIDTESARWVAEQLVSKGLGFVDAPVSGGVAGATAGTLTFIIGGSQSNFKRAEPILAAMGKNLFHAGDVGAGQIAKICNNMLLSVLMSGTAEALQLGIDNGLDAKVLSDIMLQSSGRNWTLEGYNPCPGVQDNVPSSREYQGGFMVDLMKKDLGLAMDTANKSQSLTPMGSTAFNLYRLHSKQGHGQLDFSSIFTLFSTPSAGDKHGH